MNRIDIYNPSSRRNGSLLAAVAALITTIACMAFIIICPAGVYAYEGEDVLGRLLIADVMLDISGRMSNEILLGNLVADAVLEASDADFAVVNAGDFSEEYLGYGDVTWDDICASFAENRQLAVADVTIVELRGVLEHAVSAITLDSETEAIDHSSSADEAFVQVAGFSFVYDASAPAGDRVMRIRDAEGEELDLDDESTTYRLAASRYMFDGGYGMPRMERAEDLGITLADAVAEFFLAHGEITDYETGRIDAVGTTDNTLISAIPVWAIAFAVVFFTLARLLVHRAQER